MDYKVIILGTIVFLNLLLGLFVLNKNRKNPINICYGILGFFLALWTFGMLMYAKDPIDEQRIFIWSQILYFAGSAIATSFLFFSIVFPTGKVPKKIIIVLLSLPLLVIFYLLFFTNLILKDLIIYPNNRQLVFGKGISIYYLQFFVYFVAAFLTLFRKYLKSSGVLRLQLKYILIGSSIPCLFASLINMILPLWGNFVFAWMGPVFLLVFLGSIAYAIIRYRLMDIRVVVGRTAVYVMAFATVIGLAFLMFYLNSLLAQPLSLNVVGPLIIIISILLFQFFFRFYEKLASRYFYYTFYSYQKVLTDLGRNLARILDLDKLSSLIVNTLIETMKLDKTVILLRQPETGNYQIKKNIGFREENGISLIKDDFLTQYLEKSQKPLVYEELAMMIRDSKDNWEKSKFEDLRIKMKRIEAALCLPLLVEEKIIGLIVLGNKISGDPYSFQDIELLTALSNQSAVGLQNARLYSQVEDLSQNLQIRVEAQTKELRTAYEELKVLDKAKSEFISMASHQLRTPLTAMKGYLSLFLEGKWMDNPKERKEKLQHVFISNERLIRIVNDLMNISKIELGKMEIELQKCQLEDLIQSVYEELKIEADKKNLKMIYQKPKKLLPKITIDTLKIRQVIMNLIDNAIKYTQKGKIEMGLKKSNSSILFWVKDTGEGLTDKEEKDIFQGFVRGSAGITYFIQGAGLGLYVVKKFLELHKAKIWAESPGRGKGSTFYVELPVK